MSHTPGPWHLTTDAHEEHMTWWIDAKGAPPPSGICVVRGPVDNPAEIKANAVLILSVPDLLAERDALKKALEAIEQSLIPYRARDASLERAYICSRAAINQARAALNATEEAA